MQFDRTGIILYVIKYKECVEFYENILQLRSMFSTATLTCFEFGASYLMIEKEDETEGDDFSEKRLKSCLRMNVPDVKTFSDRLISKKVAVNYSKHSWGTIAKFFDPDGNLCAFKDSEKFERQISQHD